ncbi:hypothetical protein AUP07_0817 [methanogenic archaeon mixed culture ISO4-G1]|nr:hypothetical protein AUP07_0817 [methanogenic archaeon mixed culture ISO4-G1]
MSKKKAVTSDAGLMLDNYPPFNQEEDSPTGFGANAKRSLSRLFCGRGMLGLIGCVISVFVWGFIVQILEDRFSAMGLGLPLLSFLVLSVPVWTVTSAGKMSTLKGEKSDIKTIGGLLGSFVGAVIGVAISMAAIVAAIVACAYLFKGTLYMDMQYTLYVAIAYGAMACALCHFMNFVTARSSFATLMILYFMIPGLMFLLGPIMNVMTMDLMTSVVPVMDMVDMPGAGGFGGMTLLIILSLVKAVPEFTAPWLSSIVLCIGWTMMFLALAALKVPRSE